MPVCKIAQFAVHAAEVKPCKQAIREFVEAIEANEPGTRLYVSLQSKQDKTQFLHVMVFEDAFAERRHRRSRAVKKFTEALYPRTVKNPEIVEFDAVASTWRSRTR